MSTEKTMRQHHRDNCKNALEVLDQLIDLADETRSRIDSLLVTNVVNRRQGRIDKLEERIIIIRCYRDLIISGALKPKDVFGLVESLKDEQ